MGLVESLCCGTMSGLVLGTYYLKSLALKPQGLGQGSDLTIRTSHLSPTKQNTAWNSTRHLQSSLSRECHWSPHLSERCPPASMPVLSILSLLCHIYTVPES